VELLRGRLIFIAYSRLRGQRGDGAVYYGRPHGAHD